MRKIVLKFSGYKTPEAWHENQYVSLRDVKEGDLIKLDKSIYTAHRQTDNLLIQNWCRQIIHQRIKPGTPQFCHYGYPFYITSGTAQCFITSVNYKSFFFGYSSCQYDSNRPIGYEREHRAAEKTCLLLNTYVAKNIDVTQDMLETTYRFLLQ